MQSSMHCVLPFIFEKYNTYMYIWVYTYILFCHGFIILKIFTSSTHLEFISKLSHCPNTAFWIIYPSSIIWDSTFIIYWVTTWIWIFLWPFRLFLCCEFSSIIPDNALYKTLYTMPHGTRVGAHGFSCSRWEGSAWFQAPTRSAGAASTVAQPLRVDGLCVSPITGDEQQGGRVPHLKHVPW